MVAEIARNSTADAAARGTTQVGFLRPSAIETTAGVVFPKFGGVGVVAVTTRTNVTF